MYTQDNDHFQYLRTCKLLCHFGTKFTQLLIPDLSIGRHPCCFVDGLVWEQCSCDTYGSFISHISQSLSRLWLLSPRLFHIIISVFISNLSIHVPSNYYHTMSIYTIYYILQSCVELAFRLCVCIFRCFLYMNNCKLYVFEIVPTLNYSFAARVLSVL